MKANFRKSATEKPWIIDALCNGVGPQNLPWLRPYIPQGPFRERANRHDFYYIVGGNEFNRRIADIAFGLGCLWDAIVNLLLAILYIPLAVLYFIFVRAFGWTGSFHYTRRPRSQEEIEALAARKTLDKEGSIK